jgi:hypothetical protein
MYFMTPNPCTRHAIPANPGLENASVLAKIRATALQPEGSWPKLISKLDCRVLDVRFGHPGR